MARVDVRLKAPFTATLAGPTGSGKTECLLNLIMSAKSIVDKPPVEIIYCYGAWQEKFTTVQGVRFHEGLLDTEKDIPNDGQMRWLILDDLMEEAAGKSGTNNLYTKGSHHRNICVFFVTQNPFLKSLRTMSLNTHYFFFFKNPRDGLMIVNFAKQAFPGMAATIRAVYKKATTRPWSYLFVDMRQETNDRFRLIGNYADPDRDMIVYDITE